MPTTEWLNKYEAIKDKLTCKDDLEAHFTEKVIGNMAVDVLDIGAVHFPTGQIFACDPLVELEDTLPFLQTIPAGTYPVKICVVPSEQYGDRYACVKVEVSREKPVRYELGMVGNENLDAALGDDDYFGFGVDAGMGCIADIQTQAAFKTYWAKRLEEDPDIDPYNDLFCDLLEENAKAKILVLAQFLVQILVAHHAQLIADRLFLRNLHLDAGIAVAVLFAGHHTDLYGVSPGGDGLHKRQSVLQLHQRIAGEDLPGGEMDGTDVQYIHRHVPNHFLCEMGLQVIFTGQFVLDCFVFVQPFSCRHISFLLLILFLDVHTL